MHAAQLPEPLLRSKSLWTINWALTAVFPLFVCCDYAFGPLAVTAEGGYLLAVLVTVISFAAFFLSVGGLFYPSRVSDGICASLAFGECLFLYLVKYHPWIDRWLSA